jgi:hypothetical protein
VVSKTDRQRQGERASDEAVAAAGPAPFYPVLAREGHRTRVGVGRGPAASGGRGGETCVPSCTPGSGPGHGTGRERGLSCGLWLSGLASSGSLVFVSPVFPSLAACGPGVADDCRVRAIAPIRPRANECGRLRSRVRVACAAAL